MDHAMISIVFNIYQFHTGKSILVSHSPSYSSSVDHIELFGSFVLRIWL